MRRKPFRKFVSGLLLLGLLALGLYGARHWYRLLRQRHLVSQARHFLQVSDRRNAALSLEGALAYNSTDPNACRLMAQLADQSRSPSAVLWWKRTVLCNPGSLDDVLSLAQSAIQNHNYATASNALSSVNAAGRQTAAFHYVAAALAIALNQPNQAEAHFREIARQEPDNILPAMNIAVLRLRETNSSAVAQGREFLRGLAFTSTNATYRYRALRELTVDAIRHRDRSALALSKDLLQQTNAVFEDRILRLDALGGLDNAQFKSTLAACQRDVVNNPARVVELASWEMKATSAKETLPWLRSLPASTQTNRAVATLITDCFIQTQDWRNLQAFLEPQQWHELEFTRYAFLARALRGQQLPAAAQAKWDQALKSANGTRPNLITLLGFATQWGWSSEQEELLWDIVNKYPTDAGAFQALAQTLFQGGRTRSLLELYTLAARRNPSNLAARNNVAFAALLLDAKELNPRELAQAVYHEAPTNAACATTYAVSLLLQKKNADALKVFEALAPNELNNPSVAGWYGLALQTAGQREKATKYLKFGAQSPMLPEQRALLERAMRGT